MEWRLEWVAMVVLGWLAQPGTSRVVDLSHRYNNLTVYWPGNDPYVHRMDFRGQTEKFWYESNWFGTAEHSGTHLDAPAHFSRGKWRVHQIPPDRLVGPGVVIDVTEKANKNADYKVGKDDFLAWESSHGTIPDGAILLVNTGWWAKYPNKTLVFNSSTPDDPSTFHFPGFDEAGLQWLIDSRSVHVIGVDTPSIDFGPSTDFRCHVLAFGANIPALENVANLGGLPPRGTTVFIGLINIEDGSGGPARILAVVPDATGQSNTVEPKLTYMCAALAISLVLKMLY